ncbi:MAG: TRAP transporter substrate-binding protein DctP [Alphaproteobacteria bacterium]
MKYHFIRRGIGAAALAILLIPFLAAPSVAAEVDGPKVAWNMSLWGKPRATMEAITYLAEQVSAKTGGNFAIKLHWGGALSHPKENIDGVKIGAFEMALVAPGYHPGKVPPMMLISLPFLPIQGLELQARVQNGFYKRPAIVKSAENWNAFSVMPLIVPPYELMGKGKAPTTIAGLKSMRIRATGGKGAALKRVGAVPTSMPVPETYNALERGLIQAVSLSTDNFLAYRIFEVSNWYTTNLALGLVVAVTLANTDSWKALPPQYRKLILDLAPVAQQYQIDKFQGAIDKAVAAFKKKGITPITYSKADLDAFAAVAGKPVWDAWVKDVESKGYPGRKLLDWVLAEAAKG